ncbi:hypothetical protein HEQ60_07240 [Haematospirillum sp. H1815]|uniref:hypothetical protein n=1 Tax=Haematospirillum sp. H1815 TaxID=2723108 RepID=UPI00143C8E25|nr:hypothetical protein [Haematospirillum sp. H1815]NKD77551.1 hypothetical protein [Haematospirillum sp. H1815]
MFRDLSLFPACLFTVCLSVAVTEHATAMPMASFSCNKARTPFQHLVCSDPVLLELDGRMGRHDKAWLDSTVQNCGIPRQGGAPEERARWAMVPCLVSAYRQRLGINTPLPGAVDGPETGEPGRGFIHPSCISVLLEDYDKGHLLPLPVAACNRGYSHIEVQSQVHGWLSADAAKDGDVAWIAWSDAGLLPDGRWVVAVNESGGGNGALGSVWAFDRREQSGAGDEILSVQRLYAGGDRCNGGVDKAIVDHSGILVAVNITPVGLLQAMDKTLTGLDDLPDCAACCIGTARYRVPVGSDGKVSGAPVLVSLGLNEDRDYGGLSVQAMCFASTVEGDVIGYGKTLDSARMLGTVDAFMACTRDRGNQSVQRRL